MKKSVSIILTLIMLLGMLPTISVSAATSGIYTYTISGGEATITACDTSASGAITIPSTLGGYPVTSIGDYAFFCCTGPTSISIPESVTSIGNRAFYACQRLKYVCYAGSVDEWKRIIIGKYNDSLDSAAIYYNCVTPVTEGIFLYTISGGEATIADCDTSASGAITIPSTLGGYPVTSIGNKAFYYCTGLTSISIPDSVTSIGNSAFYNCTSLTSITIPDSVTSIGGSAFYCCESLKSITIPDSVTSIGSEAFYKCTSLINIAIPESVTSIERSVFKNCKGLTSIAISDGVISIGTEAFYNCTSLTSIAIPEGVTSIGSSAFEGCSNLTSINISDSVTNIYSSVFKGCAGLTSITIPDSVTNIGPNMFYECKSLKDIIIPEGVTGIYSKAFYRCESLTSITIPDSVIDIEGQAFYNCTSLTDVYYYGGEEDWNSIIIGNYNDSLLNATIHYNYGAPEPTPAPTPSPEELYVYSIANGEATITACDTSASGDIIIPATLGGYPVTSIGDWAFFCCDRLTNITLPDSVTSIGDHAFNTCQRLTSITIPDGVTSIGAGMFESCESLEKVFIPESVTSIDVSAFDNCESIESVYYSGSKEDWISIADSLVGSPLKNATIYYNYVAPTLSPEELYVYSIANGEATITGYNGVASGVITIPDTLEDCPVTSIGNSAFENNNNLTGVTIPEGVTNIGEYAFYKCSNIENITISDSTAPIQQEVSVYLFSRMSRTVPEKTTSIGKGAFGYCYSLTSIAIPEGVTGIEESAFESCGSLTSVSIPDSVTSIGTGAFESCESLESVSIPESVTSIGTGAFKNCESLESVVIPESVTTLGEGAFENCESLKTVYYTGSEEAWDNITNSLEDSSLANVTIQHNYVPPTPTPTPTPKPKPTPVPTPEPTPTPIPANISYTFNGEGKVIVNTNVTIDRVYWGFTGDTEKKPVVKSYVDLKAVQIKAGKTGKNVVDGQNFNLERKGWYTFVAQYKDSATGLMTEVTDSFYVPVAAPKPTMTQLTDFPKQVTLNIPETERVEKVYYAMTGTDVRPEIKTYNDYLAAILNDTGRSTEKMTNGTTFEMKLDGYYTFVIRYYSSRLETVNTVFYTYCSRDNTIPVFSQNPENIAEITMTSEDALNKLYWAYMGTEKPEIKSYADFNNGIVSDKKTTTKFSDVNTYVMTKTGWYSFVASYVSTLLNGKTANKYASFENKPMPKAPALTANGAIVKVTTEEIINRIDWGFAGKKQLDITTSAEFTAAKNSGKITDAANDKSVSDGDTFTMTKKGWYVFMVNYNNTFLGKARVKIVNVYFEG